MCSLLLSWGFPHSFGFAKEKWLNGERILRGIMELRGFYSSLTFEPIRYAFKRCCYNCT
jgi:hypothetical protein